MLSRTDPTSSAVTLTDVTLPRKWRQNTSFTCWCQKNHCFYIIVQRYDNFIAAYFMQPIVKILLPSLLAQLANEENGGQAKSSLVFLIIIICFRIILTILNILILTIEQ